MIIIIGFTIGLALGALYDWITSARRKKHR